MIKTSKMFLDAQFLLETEFAQELYHRYAAPMPILDYHNHLSPKDIATNRRFNNLTEVWLEGDHYKWRAMRVNGIPERFCTGDATPKEKFFKWAETVPYTMRNPLYHWTHLELKNYFGIDQLLNEKSADEIYETCSAVLQTDAYTTQGLLARMNVEVVCTTDDPVDTLEWHQQFARSGNALKMYPTFRPDKAYGTADPITYKEYVTRLEEVTNSSITSFDALLAALQRRVDFFHSMGCRAADHGLESLCFSADAEREAPALFRKLMDDTVLSAADQDKFRFVVLLNLGRMYHAKGWVQQFHVGALRNNNSRMMQTLGPDTGFDSIGDFSQAGAMARVLDALDSTDQLAKTVIYNNNPSDNEVFATMTGNFSDGTVPGKIQYGSAWWFLDQKDGMERQINALSNMGLISRFVGMVTDSRSFLSFPRHEYFRRILCNLWGNDVRKGELPDDIEIIGKLIQGICYYNTKRFFNF
jgi:glucuronate isomerase